ncbi:flavodoxin family protein [Sessilibacter corallicola]|uniref:flavodoxin family protein n=1 Tax=Sessilibacter corallicola TaxID=2904075 RepID=UPI001E5AC6E9|nr:flavodoxin family protein [Sessilibacter corallicola]MCE2029514.1 flavodoxin family protein [Sessilibacter corallicola]
MSVKIGIVYFSQTDLTHALALKIKQGIETLPGASTLLHRIQGKEIVEGRFATLSLLDQLANVDAIVFGSPTYMGGPAAQFKAFADATSELWCNQLWAGKVAAGFTCGSALNGDQGKTLDYFSTLANQHGMIWLGLDSAAGYDARKINRLGCQAGVTASEYEGNNVHPVDSDTAYYLGTRVAKVVAQFCANKGN